MLKTLLTFPPMLCATKPATYFLGAGDCLVLSCTDVYYAELMKEDLWGTTPAVRERYMTLIASAQIRLTSSPGKTIR